MPGRKIAVLDDYQSLSKPHFDRLREAGYDVTIFTDTLLPYNRPETPQDVKDALVRRLEPFNIICSLSFPRGEMRRGQEPKADGIAQAP